MATINDWVFVLTLLATLGCGLMAGVFFAFSVFIMKALSRLPPNEGIAAMQAINVAVINPLFLAVFLGTALASVLVVISSVLRWQEPDASYLLVGGMLYLVGNLLVTIVFNVPKNNALEVIAPTDPNRAHFWTSYLTNWTAWNHIRTITALAAMTSLIIALCN